MIKKWVVKIEQIKIDSIDRHKHYLLSNQHENHLKTDISKVWMGSSFAIAFDERAERLKQQKKPDRSSYKNYATSFVFGPPIDKPMTEQQAKKLTAAVVDGIAGILDIDKGLLAKYCVSVLHNEKHSKKPHLHFLVSNVVDGRFRKELTQHKTKYAIQKVLDSKYKEFFGLDRAVYEKDPNYTKSKPLWLVRMERKHAELSKLLLGWFSDTAERFDTRLNEEKEHKKKSIIGKLVRFFKKSEPTPKQIENAEKAAAGVVSTFKLSKAEQQLIVEKIEQNEKLKRKRPAITGRCSNLSVRLIFSGHLVS